ncbi:MAG: sulfite exporter TauE/SafE family protein [Alphaproteobacteria bacterium]|nr:sulfite exporter TauE/SafE family protein [Alphaproteobacteria bacterium]
MMQLWIYTPLEFLLAALIVAAGGIVRGFTGFGSGLVMAPLLAILWGPVEAIAIMTLLGIAASVQILPRAIPMANWKEVAPMMIASMIGAPLGTAMLVSLDPATVKRIIAGFVLLATLITMAGWQYRGPRGTFPASISGALTGVINGVAGVGGPATVLYLMSLPDRAEIHRANIVCAMGVATIMVGVSLFFASALTPRVWTHTAVFLIPSIISVWFGVWLFDKLPARLFKWIVLWFLLFVSSAIMLA